MYEAYYQPTDADLLDWQEHCMMLDAEDAEEQEDDFGYGDDDLSDIEADMMTLRDAGYGTDEDYGFYGPDEY